MIIMLKNQTRAKFQESKESTSESKFPLSGITIVELAGFGISVPAACCQLREQGATILKIEPPGGDFWRTRDAGKKKIN